MQYWISRGLRTMGYSRRATRCGLCLLAVVFLIQPANAWGQSLLDRPPNLGGTWVGTPGTLQFHFMHRFDALEPPSRKVVNSPAFLLALPLPGRTLVGARYATNSVLVVGYPNEWEFFARFAPLLEDANAPFDVTLHGGYNHAAASWDGEASLGRGFGPLRVLGGVRGFSAFERDESRWAIVGGGTLRLHQFVALAGDIGTLVDRRDDEDIAWSTGLHLQIPYTPHTLSIHLANTHTTTLQSASLGTVGGKRWGFEFTVPFTFSRYFGGGESSADSMEDVPPSTGGVVDVGMTNQLSFTPATVRISVGDTVRWRNTSDLVHTVTADPALAQAEASVRLPSGASTFNSGDLRPGAVYTRSFDVPGEYIYFCIPHEQGGMIGRIIVGE